MTANLIHVRVWGDFACFTRPEMKVERVSYPVMTPSAARGILEAIFWEPQIHYAIDSIRVVKKGRWTSIRRNEVEKVVNINNAETWMSRPDGFTPIQAGGGAPDGTQRNMLALADVEYVVTAEVRLTKLAEPPKDNIQKYADEILRRAQKGKCFHRPALGCREFAADFEWVDAPAAVHLCGWPQEDLGIMLYDVFDLPARAAGFRWLRPEELATATHEPGVNVGGTVSTKRRKNRDAPIPRTWAGEKAAPRAVFFRAAIHNAVMDCHPERVSFLRADGA